jgi:DNA-directed RNA polymerase specialized sigma24 family protein
MIGSRTTRVRQKPLINYANTQDFCALFAQHVDELYQLSFLLTADHQKAKECFVAGLEDSKKENHVFKEWARSWAKRTIIQNAIRRIRPRPHVPSAPLAPPPYVVAPPSDQDSHFDADAILALDDFERFVFVMSVLEHYSEHECSLLLGCSPRQIRETQGRAFAELRNSAGSVFPRRETVESIRELVG